MLSEAGWRIFEVITTHEASEALSDYLLWLGADGIETVDRQEFQALVDRPESLDYAGQDVLDAMPDDVTIRAYFQLGGEDSVGTESEIGKAFSDFLNNISSSLPIGRGIVGWSDLPDIDWVERWKTHYKTLRLTSRIVVNPSWIDYQPAPDEIVVSLDPGGAFGSGQHETTRLCAQFGEMLIQPSMSVLDLGTGSGLLAIIAAKLGARPVTAVDIDPAAVAIAEENAAINQVDLTLLVGELADLPHYAYAIIFANIITDVLIDLAPHFLRHLKTNARLILSGISVGRNCRCRCHGAKDSLCWTAEENGWFAQVWGTSS